VPAIVDKYADAFDRILEAEYYAGDWFANGGVPTVALKFAGPMSDLEAAAAKSRYQTTQATRSPAVFGQGWDLQELTGDPGSSQLLETRRNGDRQIAQLYGIVPAELLLVELGGSSLTYQNVAGMLDTFVRVTLQPRYLSPIAAALSDLTPRTQVVRFDFEELFRLAVAQRITTEAQAIAAGIYTLEEVRRGHGLPTSSAPQVPSSLTPVGPAPEEVRV
jgi:phage portal protein BeeE